MTDWSSLIFTVHLGSTLFMTGLIWVIQLLHYPSYHYIQLENFKDYQRFHSTQITYIVGPVMLIEVLSGIYLTLQNDWALPFTFNFVGLCIIWISTLIFSIPAHNKLSLGFNSQAVNHLLQTNWIRTVTWTFRALLLLSLKP